MSRQQPRTENGVPWCTESCQCHDGKRCELLGHQPGPVCEPAVVELGRKAARLENAAHAVEEALDIHGSLIRMPSHVALALVNLQNVAKTETPPRPSIVEELRLEQSFANTLAKKCDKLQKLVEETQAELAQVKRERNFVAADDDAFWIWSDTDPNEIGSFTEGALVKMTAGQLRKLLNEDACGETGIRIVQPVGNCDGSREYAYDSSKEDGRGAKLAATCTGCRACR